MKLMFSNRYTFFLAWSIAILVTACQDASTGIPSSGMLLPTLPVTQTEITPRPEETQRTTPTRMPTETLIASIVPAATEVPVMWTRLAGGIEERYVPIQLPGSEVIYYGYALRLAPEQITFRVYYGEGQSHSVEEWQALTGASIIVNGGFFSGDARPVGRLISDGVMYGYPLNYGDRTIGVAGFFGVLDGSPQLFTLGRSSYTPRGMRFDEGLESYPILLLPGHQPTYPTETGETARRTVIGLDDDGYMILFVSDLPIFTLHELSQWLAESDLHLDSALNLDGGRSSGIGVWLPQHQTVIPAFVPLPIVIGIHSG